MSFKGGKRENLNPDLIAVVFCERLMTRPPDLFQEVSIIIFKVSLGHPTRYDYYDYDYNKEVQKMN